MTAVRAIRDGHRARLRSRRAGVVVSRVIAFVSTTILVAMLWGGHCYSVCWERGSFNAWHSDRQHSLRLLGERMLADAATRGGLLRDNWEEYLAEGVAANDEIERFDYSRRVCITRTLRPVPSVDLPSDLIVVIESYDPDQEGRLNALRLDGGAECHLDLGRMIKRDNALRRECGLDELPFEPPSRKPPGD